MRPYFFKFCRSQNIKSQTFLLTDGSQNYGIALFHFSNRNQGEIFPSRNSKKKRYRTYAYTNFFFLIFTPRIGSRNITVQL